MKCSIFSHFATEAEVLRSGSALPLSQRTAEAKKAAASKAKVAKVTRLATSLPPTPPQAKAVPVVSIAAPLHTLMPPKAAPVQAPEPPKTEEAREQSQPKAASVVALAAPLEALTAPKAAPVVSMAAPVQALEPPLKVEAKALPSLVEEAELSKAKVTPLRAAPVALAPAPVPPPVPLPERSLAWEEEFVAGVEQELRVMALKRKMVELRNTLTWPLCHWRQR